MGPFEFIIILLSFVYSLALTHLLFGVARLVRHRRTITFSWPHLLWLANVFAILILNWVTLWDFRRARELSLPAIAMAILFAVLLYLVATFVTADVDSPDQQDLRVFHDRESLTYIGGLLVGAVIAAGMNIGAGNLGVANWASQNGLLLAGFPALIICLFVKRGWLHIAAATANLGMTIAFLVLYYPVLR